MSEKEVAVLNDTIEDLKYTTADLITMPEWVKAFDEYSKAFKIKILPCPSKLISVSLLRSVFEYAIKNVETEVDFTFKDNLLDKEQYYTPVIEDIYSGYEYEVNDGGKWEKITEFSNAYLYDDNPHYAIMKDIEAGKIRVSYLTKEQIEAEGWVLNTTLRPDILFQFLREDFILVYNFNKRELRIAKDSMEGTIQTVQIFRGQCKSINEFRTILKLLEI